MGRPKRVKISKKNPVKNLLRTYGLGGAINYEPEMIYNVLKALKLLLENCGLIELDHIGRFLLRLSDSGNLIIEQALEELEDMGF
jgi:hypothetical protein